LASASSETPAPVEPPAPRTLLASTGALLAALGWLAAGQLTGLGKLDHLVGPLAFVVALAGAIVALSRARVVLWIASGVVLLVLLVYLVVSLTPFVIAVLPLQQLVRRDPPAARQVDGVVVLSGGVTPDSLLTPEVVDRLLTGLSMMRDGAAPVLVVTRAKRRNGVTADPDQRRLRSLVTREFPLLFVDSVRTTRDEAVNAMRLLRQRGIAAPHVAVVTSPLHTRRACATFERVGFKVTCVPATSRAYSVDHASSATDRLGLFRRWLYERAATVEYRAKGWQ
jgi:uncharacterized SAM-binding protein YcdF (DUF218 family)